MPTVLFLPSRRRARELRVLVLLYVAYAASRVLASDAFGPARDRAATLPTWERALGPDVEGPLNRLLVEHHTLGLAGAYY